MPYGKKSTTQTFILTLPLVTNEHDEAVLYNSFHSYWRAYNWLVDKTIGMWHQLRKMVTYKVLIKKIKAVPEKSVERKALNARRSEMLKDYGFSCNSFEKLIKPVAKYYQLHSAIAQKIAARVWDAWEKFFFKNGRKIHFRRFDSFVSFAGKNNSTGIVFVNGAAPYIKYMHREIPVALRKGASSWYQQEALKHTVKYGTLKRETIRGRWRYFVQLALADSPPVKCDRNGVMKHPTGSGKVGLDIGTQTLAISGKDICDIRLLAASAIMEQKDGLAKRAVRLQRQMDRSRRAMNKDLYNDDGTIKRRKRKHGILQRRKWNNSKRYYATLNQWRSINHKLATIRKEEHNILVNELLQYGDTFYVEKMNYKALQKRSVETKVDTKTGKIHSKKRFGKSLSRCAPAMFITMLTQKAERYNGKVIKVDTFKTKASQFDHTDDSFTKKKLSQRFAKLSDGTAVQRDLYSAFLLAHLDDKHETYDKAAISSDFPHFIEMHNNTKERLQNSQDWLPASVGF